MTLITLETYARELRAQGYSERTVAARLFAPRAAGAWAGVDPRQLDRDAVLGWLGSSPRAANTRIKYLEWVRAWCLWAGVPDATAGIRRPRQPAGVPRPVPEWDLAAMLTASAPGRVRCWVLLGAYCGLRAHESAKVALEDVEPAAGGEWLLRVVGKGGQTAVVPCPPVVVDALHAEAQRLGINGGRFWPAATSSTVQSAVRRLATAGGVSCSSHQLRHRYGTAIYSQRSDLLLTQQLLRHASPATTAGYAKVAGDAGQLAAAALPGAAELPEPGRPRLRLV